MENMYKSTFAIFTNILFSHRKKAITCQDQISYHRFSEYENNYIT